MVLFPGFCYVVLFGGGKPTGPGQNAVWVPVGMLSGYPEGKPPGLWKTCSLGFCTVKGGHPEVNPVGPSRLVLPAENQPRPF